VYQPGQKITVTWIETVYHPGCFLIDFSPAGDQNWQTLATIPHDPNTASPINYSTQVTLPQGNCPSCTLRVRQIMLGSQTATCPPTSILSGQTYYSCADIALGSTQATADLGQTTPPPADLGMADAASPTPMAMATGCHAAPVGAAAGSLAGIGLLGLAALGLVRRRRA
jgi:MYXO-CTERM domain-containing protein